MRHRGPVAQDAQRQQRRVDRTRAGAGAEQEGMHPFGVEELLAVPAVRLQQPVQRRPGRQSAPPPPAEQIVGGDLGQTVEEVQGFVDGAAVPVRADPGLAPAFRGGEGGHATGRSNVISRPSTPPGPTRPLTSTEVMAFSCHPCRACSLRSFSTLSPDILPPSIPSRTSSTLYSYRPAMIVLRSAGGGWIQPAGKLRPGTAVSP